MNGVSPRKARRQSRLQVALLLLLLITFGVFMGVAMGAVIAGVVNRPPVNTAYLTPMPEQQTATATAFQKNFKDQVYKRITQLAQTKAAATRTP